MVSKSAKWALSLRSLIRGFTLLELIIVVITIAILVSLAVPQYSKAVERAREKEAIANLKLIQAAEKIYKLENTVFYAPQGDINSINVKLRLDLTTVTWRYTISGNVNNFTARGIRTIWGARTYWINQYGYEPTCNGGGCPP